MKVVLKDGRLVGSCSSSDNETLLKNAEIAGHNREDLEIQEVTTEEWEALVAAANKPTPQEEAKKELSATDAGMARVAEDIIDLLMVEGYAFPQSVLDKIAERKALREKLKA